MTNKISPPLKHYSSNIDDTTLSTSSDKISKKKKHEISSVNTTSESSLNLKLHSSNVDDTTLSTSSDKIVKKTKHTISPVSTTSESRLELLKIFFSLSDDLAKGTFLGDFGLGFCAGIFFEISPSSF